MSRSPLALGANSLVAACAAAFAQPSAADGAATVVVTATRAPQALADVLPHTTVLDRTAIERSQAIDLASLLASESGIQFASSGPRGTATSLFVRGAPARQVLVLVDGVPLSRQDATGQFGIEHLMLDQVERIEIVRGNASSVYGSGAIGGVIQLFTRRAGAAPQASARLEAGSRGLLHGAVQGSASWGATQLSLGVSADRDTGFSALDAREVGNANPDRDGYRNTSAALHLRHELVADHAISAGWVYSDGRLDYDSAWATPVDVQRSRNRKHLLHVAGDSRWSPMWTSRVMLSRQRDDARNDESGDYGFRARYRTDLDSVNWDNQFRLSDRLSLNAGLDHQRQRIDADDGFGGLYQRSREASALFGGARGHWAAHEVSLGLRQDRISGVASRASGNLAWGWRFGPAWKLVASAANAFSAPPLGYLHAPYFGNPALKPERARSAELGLQWSVDAQRLRATLFHSRVHDELDYDPRSGRFENLARTRNRGLELSYAGRVGRTELRGSLTTQRPVDAVSGAGRLRRSELLGALTLSQDLGQGWRAGLSARHAGKRPDSGGVTLAAYTVADITVQWDMSPALQWFARVENLADVRYQTASGYNQAPRGVFAGLRWRLPG
ncbi:MAG: TonB-dependent receptor [Burkholderiales bacterium]|nr:TonB-dependent receptor [Burkholderiales bacterium]